MTEQLGKSATFAQQSRGDTFNYVQEIRQMMHGLGDNHEPLVESAKIIEEVVLKQMRAIVNRACEIADSKGFSVVKAEDLIFLLRKNKTKIRRLIRYLEIKSYKNNFHKMLDSDEFEPQVDSNDLNTEKKPKGVYAEFLELIDNTGELTSDRSNIDQVKRNRELRADYLSKELNGQRYIEFCKARRASFANNGFRHKFTDWISPNGDVKMSKEALSILGYLAYETVAEIIDLVFLVRQDQSKIHGDAIERLRLSHVNPYSYKPSQNSEVFGTLVKPISPSEINEALRRYWSPQLDALGPFRRGPRRCHSKLLAC